MNIKLPASKYSKRSIIVQTGAQHIDGHGVEDRERESLAWHEHNF